MRKQIKILCTNPQNNQSCKMYHKGRSKENLCRSCSAKINFNDIRSGKTYEEIYGVEKAAEMKANGSSNKNKWNKENPNYYKGEKNPNFGKTNINKGKKWEEIYGVEKSNSMKVVNSDRARKFISTEKGQMVLEKLINATKKEENRISVYEKWVRSYGVEDADIRMQEYYKRLKESNARIGSFAEKNGKVLKILKENGITYEEYLSEKSEFGKYRLEVNRHTNQQPINLLDNYKNRGLAGVEGAYQLDHIYSVKQGFVNNIPPEVIGNIKNLRFIPWKDNIVKSGKLTNESWDMFVYFIEEGII